MSIDIEEQLPRDQVSLRQLGSTLEDDGCRFGLWAPRADRVELALISASGVEEKVEMTCDKGIWGAFVPGVKAEQRYGYRVHGDWQPDQGIRANPAKLLLDPYAKAITSGVDYSGPIFDHTKKNDFIPDTRDSAGSVPLSVVVDTTPPPTPIARRTPMAESVIYETHVKGYTTLHPAVPEHLRGTYAGLAYPAVIAHLKEIGVTAIELLPVHHFVSEPFIVRKGLSNYWGYNSLGFFAPHAAYCSVGTLGEQVNEFKTMVSAFHEAGIEVILDVVYNHTGEGGHDGPTLSFRGIDHQGYYRLQPDQRTDYDVTGCGNSFDTSHEDVLALVLDSLRYWVTEMGVDGFRFDLATELVRDAAHHVDQNHAFKQALANDPIFEGIKLISEPWDMGPYGYQVGAWGPGWSEWNDRYRGFMRDYWRGAVGGVQELATRLAGSSDLFAHDGRGPSASINFITAHDGFTMRDLVTYNYKHNNANLEGNRDGSDDNRSWNCGFEGETDDATIQALRHRQVRNMMATLMLSRGVPMITAGDEIGRTQRGNNNAYCQDSPISWLHWESEDQWNDVQELVTKLAKFRHHHPVITQDDYSEQKEISDRRGQRVGRRNLVWMNGYSGLMGPGDWADSGRKLLGMYHGAPGDAVLIWFNASDQVCDVKLPNANYAKSWKVEIHTAEPDEVAAGPYEHDTRFFVPARSVVVMSGVVAVTRQV